MVLLPGLHFFAYPQKADTTNAVLPADSAATMMDSSALKNTSLPSSPGDTTGGLKVPDTLRSVSAAAAPAIAAKEAEKKKINLIKRSYNARQQKIFAIGMMFFVVGIFTAAQQWNPK